ncbi:unnamed protein product [Euphydryas editha]|uniref:SWIM-type domain-containing protein n=1 Tax=Euphydryas editha TaxID=104508 RepID=A0AAU9UC56_EUPED|nr:unnamed protein product [Euphydryas editha]
MKDFKIAAAIINCFQEPYEDSRENGRNGISGYYCSCIHGKRTLGCCAHVMSVLNYLGRARHEEQFAHPASFLDHVVLDIENR